MAYINEMILSEINGLQATDKIKDFLKWLVEFEREHMEKDQFAYKQELEKKVSELLAH